MPIKSNRQSPPGEGFTIDRATIAHGKLVMEPGCALERAVGQGILFLRKPSQLDLGSALKLARLFNQERGVHPDGDDAYRGFRELGKFCFDRANYQIEQLIIDRRDRSRLFPGEVLEVCHTMCELAEAVLWNILDFYGIEESLRAEATGGAAAGTGTQYFVANHYDPGTGHLGCAPHTDTGYVTVLHPSGPGLEIGLEGEWKGVSPPPGYFVVNFGVALEVLCGALKHPPRAVLHRVVPTSSDGPRVSIAAFASAPNGGCLYRYEPGRGLVASVDVDRFLAEHDAQTWDESRRGRAQERSIERVSRSTKIALERSTVRS